MYKKFILALFTFLLLNTCSFGFEYKSIKDPVQQLPENITNEELLTIIGQEEKDLSEYLTSFHKKSNKDKLFLTFYRNLDYYRKLYEGFWWIVYDNGITEYGDFIEGQKNIFEVDNIKYTALVKNKMLYDTKILNSLDNGNSLAFKYNGTGTHVLATIDHQYLYNKFKHKKFSLDKSVLDFLDMQSVRDRDLDNYSYEAVAMKWVDNMPYSYPNKKTLLNKWIILNEDFLNNYPNFIFKGTVNKYIVSYKSGENILNDGSNVVGDDLKEEPEFLYFLFAYIVISIFLFFLIFLYVKLLHKRIITKLQPISNKCTNIIKKFSAILVQKCIIIPLLSLFGVILIGYVAYISINNNVLPKCDSKFAEEEVRTIFKLHEDLYKDNRKNVAEIRLSGFEPVSYDKEIKRYTCKARLTMYAEPDLYIEDYPFRYNNIEFGVDYSIFKERGENKVRASWIRLND